MFQSLVMFAVRCEVVRWVADEPFPGWVEASLTDALGRHWTFFDKPPVFGPDIGRSSEFPMPGMIRCEVVSSPRDDLGAEFLEIRLLDGVESEEGSSRFLVPTGAVIPA